MSKLGFAKLYVQDLDAMGSFCIAAFAADEVMRISLEDMDEIMLSLGGEGPDLVLMRRHEQPEPVPGTMYGPVGLMVEDCDAAVTNTVAAGGTMLMAPVNVEAASAKVAFVASPEGHQFELVQPMTRSDSPSQ